MRSLNDAVAEYSISETGRCGEDIRIWADRYISSLRSPSPATVRSYRSVFSIFIAYCTKHEGHITITDIGAAFINNFLLIYMENTALMDLQNKRISQEEYNKIVQSNSGDLGLNNVNISVPYQYEKSVSHRLTVIKQLLRFISANNKEQIDFVHRFDKMLSVHVQKRKTDYCSTKELERLKTVALQWPYTYTQYIKEKGTLAPFRAWRNSFLILLYTLTGMRTSEALDLRFEDFEEMEVDATSYYAIRIRAGKGNKERQVIAPMEFLKAHLEQLQSFLGSQGYIAPRSPKIINKPMSYTALYLATKPLFQAAGIQKSGFHNIRRGYATEEIASGRSITKVALQLGHGSVNTTFDAYIKNNLHLLAVRSQEEA